MFDVGVLGIVAVDTSEFGDQPGTCVTVLSTLLGVESPGAIVNSFAIPEIGLLAGGQIRSEAIGECDVDALQGVGYFSVFGVIVAVDNTFALQTSFLLPDGVTPDAIVVGDPTVNGLVPLMSNAEGVTCYGVVGKRSADDDSSFPPDIGIIVDGALHGSSTLSRASCNTTALLAAGYDEPTVLDAAP